MTRIQKGLQASEEDRRLEAFVGPLLFEESLFEVRRVSIIFLRLRAGLVGSVCLLRVPESVVWCECA